MEVENASLRVCSSTCFQAHTNNFVTVSCSAYHMLNLNIISEPKILSKFAELFLKLKAIEEYL